MIVVRLMGGLGNQMFQYATAKAMALRTDNELALDASLLGPPALSQRPDPIIRHFDLDVFALPERFATAVEVALFNGHPCSYLLKLAHHVARWTNRFPLFIQSGNKFHEELLRRAPGNVCLVGRWQSEDYFDDHRDTIRKAFSFRSLEIPSNARQIALQISNEESVVIQTRRQDYVTHPVYSRCLGALTDQYYFDAVDLMRSKLRNPKLRIYVGGDDMQWCADTFGRIENTALLSQEQSKQGYCSHLWLLSHFQNHIISNSTYAWWGAWLGERQNSVIVAPAQWSRDVEQTPARLVPSRWISIANEFEQIP